MEEREQQQGWSRERRPVESGPRPYSGRGGVDNLNDWEEGERKRQEGGWRAPGGVGRQSSALTLDSFLLPEGPRPVKGRGGGKRGMMANPGSNFKTDEKKDWNEKEWSGVKSIVQSVTVSPSHCVSTVLARYNTVTTTTTGNTHGIVKLQSKILSLQRRSK